MRESVIHWVLLDSSARLGPTMSTPWLPQFLFAVCQCRAEHALKNEIAAGSLSARPAFSRPGFVTFKLDAPCERPDQFQLLSTFARTYGFCLGKVQGELLSELVMQLWKLPAVLEFVAARPISDLHVWQRDTAVPGAHGFEPGPTALAVKIEEAVRQHAPLESLRMLPVAPRRPTQRNRWVLDLALVEPGEWWVGCHRTTRRLQCYPGGVRKLELPPHAVSRAYLKMQEALHWSALPTQQGDVCVELGCAPGGASQALLDAGLQVVGVDPAAVDPEVETHPRFLHVRRRTRELPHRQLRGARWLTADMNVAPAYTLDAVEEIVMNGESSIRGILLTLKLADLRLADKLPEFVARVKSWGYQDVRTRQLAFNRQELCLVALRSRGQRRMFRKPRRRSRHDVTHASRPPAPHFPSQM